MKFNLTYFNLILLISFLIIFPIIKSKEINNIEKLNKRILYLETREQVDHLCDLYVDHHDIDNYIIQMSDEGAICVVDFGTFTDKLTLQDLLNWQKAFEGVEGFE